MSASNGNIKMDISEIAKDIGEINKTIEQINENKKSIINENFTNINNKLKSIVASQWRIKEIENNYFLMKKDQNKATSEKGYELERV